MQVFIHIFLCFFSVPPRRVAGGQLVAYGKGRRSPVLQASEVSPPTHSRKARLLLRAARRLASAQIAASSVEVSGDSKGAVPSLRGFLGGRCPPKPCRKWGGAWGGEKPRFGSSGFSPPHIPCGFPRKRCAPAKKPPALLQVGGQASRRKSIRHCCPLLCGALLAYGYREA